MPVLALVLGLGLLVLGGEALVRGAVALALRLRIPAVVIGLTVVAFGTSAPELAVSALGAAGGQPDVAIGNVVGSNIFNVLAILGISGLIVPLVVDRRLLRVEAPLVLLVSVLVWGLALDGVLGRVEGAVLLSGVIVYTTIALFMARGQGTPLPEDVASDAVPVGRSVLTILVGLAVLVGASRLTVWGASSLARAAGVSELAIGLTVVAVGTSLPEVAASVTAAWKGERDIAVGNVVGSNLFNLLGVLGVAALVAPHGLTVAPAALRLDMLVMTATAIVCLPVFWSRAEVDRAEGAVLLAGYVLYLGMMGVRALHGPDAVGTAAVATAVTGLVLAASLVGMRARTVPLSTRTP